MNIKLLRQLKVALIKKQTGYIKHYTVVFNRYDKDMPDIAYANIKKHRGKKVWGILFKIFKTDLKKLDRWEGYPVCYRRIKLPVKTTKFTVKAIVYISPVKKHSISRPTKNYLNLITEASKQLPGSYRFKFKKTPAADINWSFKDAL